jgi:hypothetical protein
MGTGGWIAYDVMRDAAMLSLLMNNHPDTVVVTSPSQGTAGNTYVSHSNSNENIKLVLGILVGLALIGLCVFFFR